MGNGLCTGNESWVEGSGSGSWVVSLWGECSAECGAASCEVGRIGLNWMERRSYWVEGDLGANDSVLWGNCRWGSVGKEWRDYYRWDSWRDCISGGSNLFEYDWSESRDRTWVWDLGSGGSGSHSGGCNIGGGYMAIQDHPGYAALVTFTNSMVIKIRSKQAQYYVEKGKYFQGIKTPNEAVGRADGQTLKSIAYGLHPSDQDDSWNTFDPTNFKVNTKVPAHIRIDVYQAPEGWGWILIIDFWRTGLGPDAYGRNGDHWVYKHNEGPKMSGGVWGEWYIQSDEE